MTTAAEQQPAPPTLDELKQAMQDELGGVNLDSDFERLYGAGGAEAFGPGGGASAAAGPGDGPASDGRRDAEAAAQGGAGGRSPTRRRSPRRTCRRRWTRSARGRLRPSRGCGPWSGYSRWTSGGVRASTLRPASTTTTWSMTRGSAQRPRRTCRKPTGRRSARTRPYFAARARRLPRRSSWRGARGLSIDALEELVHAQNAQEFQAAVQKHVQAISPREREMAKQIDELKKRDDDRAKELAELKKGQAPPQQFGGLGAGANQNVGNNFGDMMRRIGSDPDYRGVAQRRSQGSDAGLRSRRLGAPKGGSPTWL